MKSNWKLMILGGALVLAAGVAQAQEPPPGPPPDANMIGGGPEGMIGARMEILGFGEAPPGKVVTGAPYSAVAVTESKQTLADGNTIDRKVQSSLYRDSQGRTRRETALPGVGPLAASGQPHTFVMIHDPVARTAFVLHADQKVADQLSRPGNGQKHAGGFESKFQAHIQQEIANGTLIQEDLGVQTINGVSAQGTRYTKTIPAGKIGNAQPIVIISEHWYSPDLQIVVKSTRSDPRFGTTTYTITTLQRQEPAASLFAVPADYTVKQGGPHRLGRSINSIGPGGAAPAELPPPPPGE